MADETREASVTINGTVLTSAQSATVRVAINDFIGRMNEPHALGHDAHGEAMRKLYLERCHEVESLIFVAFGEPNV